MIKSMYKTFRKVLLSVSEEPHGFKIQLGELKDPTVFEKGQAILIPGDNPNLLWDLLHENIGLPYPRLIPRNPSPGPQVKEPETLSESSIEESLQSLNAKEIVEKVAREKGVTITNSLKSKAAIIKKALKIYAEL